RRGGIFEGGPDARMLCAKEVVVARETDRYPGEAAPQREDRSEDAHRLASPRRRAGGKRKPGSERREQEHAREVGLVTLRGLNDLKAHKQEGEQAGGGGDEQRARERSDRLGAP